MTEEQWKQILSDLEQSSRPGPKLLKLPDQGCLRVIVNRAQQIEWHEFDLSEVLVVVLEDHPVGVTVMPESSTKRDTMDHS